MAGLTLAMGNHTPLGRGASCHRFFCLSLIRGSGIACCVARKDLGYRTNRMKYGSSYRLLHLLPRASGTVRLVFRVSALVLASTSAWAQTVPDPKPVCPSVSTNLPQMTYDENTEYLANSDCRTSLLDAVRFIPLGQDENNYLS